MDENGIWILQMAELPNMLRKNMFDNIRHEHFANYHLAPIGFLLKRCSMKLVDLEMNFVNGSSYRFYIRKVSGSEPTAEVLRQIAKVRFEEFNLALDTDAPYKKFKKNLKRNRNDLLFFKNQERSKGKKIFVYGASTKGNVLLQYCELNEEIFPFAAERNPRKWGTKTLGSNISNISEEDAREMKPDYYLVLTYHFLDEMLVREKEFTDRGGKFILPVPTVRLAP